MNHMLVPFIKADGPDLYLAGSKCRNCGHQYVGERAICANCTERDAMDETCLASTGEVYTYTVVHRSYPGVKTPFVDVIVDLDGGGHIKGTLTDVDPEDVRFGMPVRTVFREVVPVGEDRPYLNYFFVPQEGNIA